jgi:hypothetical protein
LTNLIREFSKEIEIKDRSIAEVGVWAVDYPLVAVKGAIASSRSALDTISLNYWAVWVYNDFDLDQSGW